MKKPLTHAREQPFSRSAFLNPMVSDIFELREYADDEDWCCCVEQDAQKILVLIHREFFIGEKMQNVCESVG